jgi:hypothetical protein
LRFERVQSCELALRANIKQLEIPGAERLTLTRLEKVPDATSTAFDRWS